MARRTWNIWTLVCGIAGVCLVFAGVFFAAFPYIYRREVNVKTNLVEESFLFPIWRDLPLPIYKKLYFFNITNSEEFVNNGTALQVEEVGPYVYVGNWTKEDVQWSDEGTLSYREVKTFHFSPEESVGSEDDKIYTLNAPYLVAASKLDSFPFYERIPAKVLMSTQKLVIYRSIKELSFGGYKDPIIKYGKYIIDSPYKDGKFAWFYVNNGTDEGAFDVFTGELDHKLLNTISKWKGHEYMNFWKDRYCNMVNGTNAEFHSPFEDDDTEYTFFQPLVCRSVTYKYSGNQEHSGIFTKRFESVADTFSRDNPDNYCFNTETELKSGALDVSNCWFGAPVVLSFPHFHLADPSYLDNIEGLSPNKLIHGSHIDAEPLTGVTVDLSIKFQMNLNIKPIPELSAFKNVSEGVYPVFWLDLLVQLPDELMDTINYQLFRPRTIVYTTLSLVVMISIVGIMVAAYKIKAKQSEETEPLIKRRYSKDELFNASSMRYPLLESHTGHGSVMSLASYTSILSGETQYQSFSDEESDEEVSTVVETEHYQTKVRRVKTSFKDGLVLTVI